MIGRLAEGSPDLLFRLAESALGRKVDYQVINEYRGAISALNSGEPFMFSRPDAPLSKSVTEFARILDRQTVEAVQLARA